LSAKLTTQPAKNPGQKNFKGIIYVQNREKETSGRGVCLLLAFTASKRDNLAAWMPSRSDGDNYGKIIVYSFPGDMPVFESGQGVGLPELKIPVRVVAGRALTRQEGPREF